MHLPQILKYFPRLRRQCCTRIIALLVSRNLYRWSSSQKDKWERETNWSHKHFLFLFGFVKKQLSTITVDRKIIRALEIIRVKKLLPSAGLWNKSCQIMIFRLYTSYKKHEMIKIVSQYREKL